MIKITSYLNCTLIGKQKSQKLLISGIWADVKLVVLSQQSCFMRLALCWGSTEIDNLITHRETNVCVFIIFMTAVPLCVKFCYVILCLFTNDGALPRLFCTYSAVERVMFSIGMQQKNRIWETWSSTLDLHIHVKSINMN